MATLKLNSIRCHRKHDVIGDDEPVLKIDSAIVWNEVMNTNQDQVRSVNVTRVFKGTTSVTLDEVSNGKSLQIGAAFPVKETGNPASMQFKTAGTHYEVFFTVS
ncbi:MAG TPA: hypothetical protein VFV67_29045 [Actinophytocola sp.]|uniref:hypothetical protein n=1 Tax=Actinophytocola sp. TaxID=1872138 RepID=UPI002DB89EED|nr:hypothetical protein [Actinophytocola sp.]HEU5474713.1 hypothetical protein [Actinophytocola sp.]